MLRRDPCTKCGLGVFLAERLIVSSARLLYHRTCFRCARCNTQLTLANYYETEDGRFCCETCPDEEKCYDDKTPGDSSSSSEPWRRPPVTVDTNDLPSSDVVNNVDTVQSSETEDYAKDRTRQSLSIVQMRRKLFENEPKHRNSQVFDSGQLRGRSVQVSNDSKQPEAVKTDQDKLMAKGEESKSTTEDEFMDVEDVGMMVGGDASSEDEPTISKAKEDEPTIPKAKEDEPTIPKAKEDEPTIPKAKEDETIIPKAKEDEPTIPKAKEDEPIIPKAEEDEPITPKAAEDEPTISKDKEDESTVPKAEEHELIIPKAEEHELIIPKAKEDELIIPKAKEDELIIPMGKEDEPMIPKALEDDPIIPKALEDEPIIPKVLENEPTVPKAKEDEPTVPKAEDSEPIVFKAVEDEPTVSNVQEDEPSVSNVKEDEPFISNTNEYKPTVSTAKDDEHEDSEIKEDDSLVSSAKKAESVSIAEEDLHEAMGNEILESQVQDKTETASDEDSPKIAEVQVPASESPKDESQLTENDDTSSKMKSDRPESEDGAVSVPVINKEKASPVKDEVIIERKSNVPPRPPPPSVDAMRKPPVTPRKTSPVATPREKPTVERIPSYPAGLNPFSDDEDDEDEWKEAKDSSNPFDTDESEEEVTLRRKEEPSRPPQSPQRPYTHHGGSSKTEDDGIRVDTRRFIPAPAHLNPFWEGEEEPEDEEDDFKPSPVSPQKPPVPKPRTVLSLAPDTSPGLPGSPFSNRSTLTRSSGRFGSANSLSSVVSSASTMRRKKHAAPPPPVSSANTSLSPRATSFSPGSALSVPSSPTLSSGRSTLGRSRKSRPAPQPPSASPVHPTRTTWDPTSHYRPLTALTTSTQHSEKVSDEWQEGKLNKDELNRNRQNQRSTQITEDMPEELGDDSSFHSSDKSSHGKWKRKKGPAPPRPIPQRRQIRAIPQKELKRELDDIEVLQLELERQGVNLERTIRKKFDENPDASESSMTPDIEELVLQLFELVNEKNELFRKQAELMYLRRQQRLEEEHADLEYQIRILMEQPDRNKTDIDKAKEEKLIQRLVEVVERRNEIVECLEMDRLREAEEDSSIHSRLELFASKSLALNDAYANDLYKSTPALTCCAMKEKKKKKDKSKKGILKLHKKDKHVDADKDIDETEVEQIATEKKSKKKWF